MVALAAGSSRLTDHLTIGVIAKTVSRSQIDAVLHATGKASRRQRDLPAPVVVYYVIALALFFSSSYREVLRQLLEGLRWLGKEPRPLTVATKSALSQARARLGAEPLERLFAEVAQPLATPATPGAWWRGKRLVALDATLLDIADTPANRDVFGLAQGVRGQSAYPQMRLLALVETGTHAIFGARWGAYRDSETELARPLLDQLTPDMLCLCDRGYWSYSFWQAATATGAALVWRGKRNLRLERERQDLADGSYLSKIYLKKDWKTKRNGLTVRVIDYRLEGVSGGEPFYRVLTNLLDPATVPAQELAALYAERWEQEGVFDEIKTHLRGPHLVLRSKTPELARQEGWGLLLAHYAVRGLMQEAAQEEKLDPDRLSFVHAVRVVRRSLPQWSAFSPSAASGAAPGGAARTAR